MHNWTHKAELQAGPGRSPARDAVDETVIQSDGKRYWLYAAVDSDPDEPTHTTLEESRTHTPAGIYFRELREKHDGDDAITPKGVYHRHGLDHGTEPHGNRNSVERIF